MYTLKVNRSAGGGGMTSMSNTRWPAAIWLGSFSAGLYLAVPATNAPRWISVRMNALTLANIAVIKALLIG